jgi:hypothetical protein
MKSIPKKANWVIYIPFVILIFLCGIRLQYPELSHGDDWADANTLNSGENMARLGIGVSHGLPINYPAARELPPIINPYNTKDPLNHFGTYTRTPPLSSIFNAFLWACGLSSMFEFRLVMLALSFGSVVLFYLFLKEWFKGQEIAAFGTLFYVCNPFFIANIDSLHFPVLVDLIRNAALFLFVGLQSCTGRKFYTNYAIIFVLFFLLAFAAYEYTVFFGVFILFWLFINRKEINRLRLFLVLLLPSAFVLSFFFHLLLIAIHVGSFQEAFSSRIANAVARATGAKMHLGSQLFSWESWFQAVALRFPLQVLFFPVSTIVIALSSAFFFKTGEQRPTLLQKSLILAAGLGASGYVWYILMPAHCLDHAGLTFLQRHLVPAVAVLSGGILTTFLLQMLHNGWKMANAQTAIWALALAGGVASILGSELPITRDKIESEREFEKVVASLRQLAPDIAYEDYVGMNVFRPTNAFTYYLKARTLHIPDTRTFDNLAKKPSFFLLVPTNDPETQKLADLLSRNYRMAFFADNRRLPFYVFVKNR